MTDVTAPTGQAPTMAPPVRFNDQCLPRIRWVQIGYLNFSANGTKREVSYYQEYLANVVKHRWFLSSEPAGKPNPTAQKSLDPHPSVFDTPAHVIWESQCGVSFFIRYRDFLHRRFSASPSDKILEPNNTLEDRKELS
nr:hypothetical protein [Tanacetum cinerariifolium]